ncbi:TPA: AlpA family phage regulatory protein [Escherichia coli]|nr:AlpA family phage regulatory protein [Escherichia coli]
MTKDSFIPPTPEQRRAILAEYGFEYEKQIREEQCKEMTSLSRSSRWGLEQRGAFPSRRHLGRNSCAWLLSDVLWWIRNPPQTLNVNNPHQRALKKQVSINAGN